MKPAPIRVLAKLCLCGLALSWACKPPTTNHPADGGDDADASRDADQADDEPIDEPSGCDDSSDCDDAIACTQDVCGVGGLCRNIPLDDLCPGEEVCVPRVGCEIFQCDDHDDCDDRIFCNGTERCVGDTCYAGTARDCDDGNDCTADSCNVMTDRCVHDPLPSCTPTDGGPDGGPDPFDPAVHYSGSFRVFNIPRSDCGAATFNITRITITSTEGELRLMAGAFPMTQAPRPTGESFDVTYTQGGCGSYRLTASFADSDTFYGTWTAVFSGGCGACDDQFDDTVTGVRE
jgi:hypothetical protein